MSSNSPSSINQPSPSQRESLTQLTTDRELLLQIHWAWNSGATPAPMLDAAFEQCIASLKKLGGKPITRTQCDTQVIGTDSQIWHTASVWSLPSPEALQALVDSNAFTSLNSHASSVRALVGIQPKRLTQRALRFARLMMRLLPAPAANSAIPSAAISGGVNPTVEQFDAFKGSPQHTTIHMFNLLKFVPEVSINGLTKTSEKCTSGKSLYGELYAPVACQCIFRLGGRIVALGRYKFTLIGQGGDPSPNLWDEIAIAEYPGRSAFLRMLSNDLYQKAVVHREAALDRTELWATTPLSN
ncbi:MAG: hypothetical protein QE278_04535 [Limnobacter sp.]|nr:hypothetical protein [Limnobacter sp.]